MKKLLTVILGFVYIININITFAGEFTINTSLPLEKQTNYKSQIDKAYKSFENRLSTLSEELQISNISNITGKIDTLLKKILSDKNIFILTYLNYLLKEKLSGIQNPDNINIGSILKIEGVNTNNISCNVGYFNQNGTCIKTDNSTISVNIQNATRKCYIDFGEGQETLSNNTWSNCVPVSCISNYHKEGNFCIKNAITCSGSTHLEGSACISDTVSCQLDGGTGDKIWNGVGYGVCLLTKCSTGYHREGDSCKSNNQKCDILNGTGDKIWNGTNYSYCEVKSCNLPYKIYGNNCLIANLSVEVVNDNKIIENTVDFPVAKLKLISNVEARLTELCVINTENNNISGYLTLYVDGASKESKKMIDNKTCYSYGANFNMFPGSIKNLEFRLEGDTLDYGKKIFLSLSKPGTEITDMYGINLSSSMSYSEK